MAETFRNLFPSKNRIPRTNVYAGRLFLSDGAIYEVRNYLYVPVCLVFVITDAFWFKVPEEVDNGFYGFFDLSTSHEMFDAVTSFPGSDENHICRVRESEN